ncbi:MAG: hypothetical protein ACXVP4_13710 [Bacteroidia bacterium]
MPETATMIRATNITTMITPVTAPALNIPATAAQLCKVNSKNAIKALRKNLFFIS